MSNDYAHLLRGVKSGLDCQICLEIDDLADAVPLETFMNEALSFFQTIGESPKRVTYSLRSEGKARRATVNVFQKRMMGQINTIGRTLHYVEITAPGYEPNDISDTWTPRAIAGISRHGRVLNAFFDGPARGDDLQDYLLGIVHRAIGGSNFASAEMFRFPWMFSPSAYFAGITYDHSVKQLGGPTFEDGERIANWSNHCYRGLRPSDGYMRDVYPINILTDKHLRRQVGGHTLREWIADDPRRGKIEQFDRKFLWQIPDDQLVAVQSALDANRLFLSGFPPDTSFKK